MFKEEITSVPEMDIANEFPFANCSDYQVITEFSNPKPGF